MTPDPSFAAMSFVMTAATIIINSQSSRWLTERAEGADDIPVVFAACLLTVGSHEAVALFRPRVAEVVVLFPGVEEIVIVNRCRAGLPGTRPGFR